LTLPSVGSLADHLDEPTVRALGNKPLYLVPLGIKSWYVFQLDICMSFNIGVLGVMGKESYIIMQNGIMNFTMKNLCPVSVTLLH
jgi:hypothetical protein